MATKKGNRRTAAVYAGVSKFYAKRKSGARSYHKPNFCFTCKPYVGGYLFLVCKPSIGGCDRRKKIIRTERNGK